MTEPVVARPSRRRWRLRLERRAPPRSRARRRGSRAATVASPKLLAEHHQRRDADPPPTTSGRVPSGGCTEGVAERAERARARPPRGARRAASCRGRHPRAGRGCAYRVLRRARSRAAETACSSSPPPQPPRRRRASRTARACARRPPGSSTGAATYGPDGARLDDLERGRGGEPLTPRPPVGVVVQSLQPEDLAFAVAAGARSRAPPLPGGERREARHAVRDRGAADLPAVGARADAGRRVDDEVDVAALDRSRRRAASPRRSC